MSSLLDGLTKPFGAWLRLVLRRPALALALGLVAALIGGALAVTRLGFNPDLNAVIGGDHRFNRVFEDYRSTFGEQANLLVVLHDGHDPRTQALARELVQAYRQSGQFESAVPVLPKPSPMWLLHEPAETLDEALHRLEPLREALTRPPEPSATLAALRAIPSGWRTQDQQRRLDEWEEALAVVPYGRQLPRPLLWSDVVDALVQDVASGDPRRVQRAAEYAPLMRAGMAAATEELGTPDGAPWNVPRFWAFATGRPELAEWASATSVALVVVTPFAESTQARARDAQDSGRPSEAAALASFQQIFEDTKVRYPTVAAGLTGRPLLNAQEQAAQQRSSAVAGMLSFAFVLVVVVVFVRRVRLAWCIGLALASALAWTMGVVALTIGELNVLSAAFAVVLAALGVDFGIHLATAFEHRKSLGRSTHDAILEGFTTIGRGVIAGALTTALAFLMTSVAEFQAIAELGQIAAVGMMLCLLSMFTILPALLAITERDGQRALPLPDPTLAGRPYGPRLVAFSALAGVGVLAGSAFAIGQHVGFNTNRLDLLDPAVSAIPWMRVMDQHSDQSSRFGVAIADSEDRAREMAAAFRAHPEIVRDVVWLGDVLPPDAEARRSALRSWVVRSPPLARERSGVFRPDVALERLRRPATIRESVEGQLTAAMVLGVDGTPVSPFELAEQRRALERLIRSMEGMVDGSRLRQSLAALIAAVDGVAAQTYEMRRLRRLAQHWMERLHETPTEFDDVDRLVWLRTANLAGTDWETLLRGELATLAGLANEMPTTVDELDPAVRRAYHSDDGRWLVQVFANRDIWQEEPAYEFIALGESITPDFTGPAAQYFRAVELMQEGLLIAAVYALLAVFVLLVFDFFPARWALLPVGVLAAVLAGFTLGADWTFVDAVPFALAIAAVVCVRWVYPVILAAAPLAVAIALTLGTMALAGQPFNPANIVVLPALLGIGIDIGIHLVHAARQGDGHVRILVRDGVAARWQRLRQRRPLGAAMPPLLSPTARAVLMTSVTTMVGFGTLQVAGHEGIRSLGWLFAVAVFWCMAAAYVVLPAMTRLLPLPTAERAPADGQSR